MDIFDKKINIYFNVYILSLLIIYLTTFLGLTLIRTENLLFISIALVILSIPTYFVAKKINKSRILPTVLNSVAIGFIISFFYIKNSIDFQMADAAFPTAISITIILITKYISKYSGHNKWLELTSYFLGIIIIVFSIIKYNNDLSVFYQILFLSVIYLSSLIGLLLLKQDDENLWFVLSIMHFLSFLIIFLIVISEGDGLDGFSSIGSDSNKKKRKKKKEIEYIDFTNL